MAMTNTQQAALYSRLADTMGQEEAEILMEQLPPSGWDNVATKDDLEILRAAFTTAIVEARAEAREGLAGAIAAIVETNAALREGLAGAGAAIVETNAALREGLAGASAAIVETRAEAREGLAGASAAFTTAIVETNAALREGLAGASAAFTTAIVEARAEAREGFARLERRLAYYLVAVAALIVGFGLAVWIPLMATLHEYTTSAPPPAAPAAAPAQSGHVPGNAP